AAARRRWKVLKLEGVHAFYGPVHVLFSVDLEVADGEIVALLGTNGAGKTTILRTISGVLKPALGHITWNGEAIDGLRPADIVEELLETVRRLNAEGVGVVIVEQHVDLALDMASRAYFLERGEVRFSGPAEDLRGRDDLLRSVFLAGAQTAESAELAEEALAIASTVRRRPR